MGVPRLFPWLTGTFPQQVRYLTAGSRGVDRVAHLYIDANPLIHNSAQEVYGYGKPTMKAAAYAKLSETEKRLAVFEGFWSRLMEILSLITPTEVLYIAIDGAAPLAKQAQQRQRRFESRIADIREGKVSEGFNSTFISPGTVFMIELTKFIHLKIREMLTNAGQAPYADVQLGLQVYFSSCRVPGEGEHKIMDFIRIVCRDGGPRAADTPSPAGLTSNRKCCFCGPDGDLIMLTLATHLPHIYLLREDQEAPGTYYYIAMGAIHAQLPRVLRVQDSRRTVADVVKDFVLIGFFVGNDFLPRVRMFMYLERGLEDMFHAYANMNIPLTKDGYVSIGNFSKFVREIANEEVRTLTRIATDTRGKWAPKTENVPNANAMLRGCLENGKLDYNKFRAQYYEKEFADSSAEPASAEASTTDELIDKMCWAYLHTIIWVFEYYVTRGASQSVESEYQRTPPSWRWFYPYFRAPLMRDFSRFLSRVQTDSHAVDEVYTFEPDGPSPPFLQLLSILPAPSRMLLPKEYQHLYTDPSSPLRRHGYLDAPVKDYESAINDHTAVVVLPFVDPDVMASIYETVKPTIRYYRNEIDGCYRFGRRPKSVRYSSKYGTIETCPVGMHPFTLDAAAGGCIPRWYFDYSSLLLNERNLLSKFYDVPKATRRNVHWGQLKLFFTILLPFIRFWDRKKLKKVHVVYAGAAPGSNIALFADLIPGLTMDLYDPAPFAIKSTSRVKIFNQLFLDEDAQKYAGRNDIFFFSDIRRQIGKTIETERLIDEDMEMQQRWVEIIQPVEAFLKFRLPYMTPGIETVIPTTPYKEYLDGEVYLQSVAPQTSTETRLRPMRNARGEYTKKRWRFDVYEEQMFYQNMTVREKCPYIDGVNWSFDGLLPPELIGDWDCVSMTFMLYEYLRQFKKGKSEDYIPSPIEVIDLYKSIVGALSTTNRASLAKIREGMKLLEAGDTNE